ncbi:ferredoxin [candidate division TA06 bacterium]|uniref:Ferredoxin n=1 Tax=candidate division TA06 bacterium TaxID=2250710 RepID=A0A660SQA0_UNCT6|nr:MAG: ferredoxin [candidate division TA06 bacterium]
MNKFQIFVNTDFCKGCGLCVAFCPKKVLELDKVTGKSTPIRIEDCIGCKTCENMCPDFAIAVEKEGEPSPYENIKSGGVKED